MGKGKKNSAGEIPESFKRESPLFQDVSPNRDGSNDKLSGKVAFLGIREGFIVRPKAENQLQNKNHT